jgi:hypothetical protein
LHAVYSNFGYGLAGLVLERAARQPYEQFVARRLFEPLGMASSGFFLDQAQRARLATGYDTDGRTPIRYWHMILRPFGGINSTARDMGSFVQWFLNRGQHGGRQLLSREGIARMETPGTSLAARSGLAFGYGLGINQSFRDVHLFFGHGGDGDGYLAHFAYSRDAQRGYFVLINAFNHAALRAIRAEIERFIVAGLPPARPAPSVAVPESVLRRYVGEYELAAWRFPWTTPEQLRQQAIRVVREHEQLYTTDAQGDRSRLIPVADRHFRREHEPVATCAFVEDEDGTLYFQEDENYRRVAGEP